MVFPGESLDNFVDLAAVGKLDGGSGGIGKPFQRESPLFF